MLGGGGSAGAESLVVGGELRFFMGGVGLAVFVYFGVVTMDYLVGRGLRGSARAGERGRGFLLISVVGNLGVLGFFKYWDFFVSSVGAGWMMRVVFLPVGISFYTFQELGYVIDVYRGRVKAAGDYLDFGLSVLFPQLVAGPIEGRGNCCRR